MAQSTVDETVARVVQRVPPPGAAAELEVVVGLLPVVRLVLAISEMGVRVRLMHGDDVVSRVDHRPGPAPAPDEPVVEAGTADKERRQRMEVPGRKDEPVDGGRSPRDPPFERTAAETLRVVELAGVDAKLARLADEQKTTALANERYGREKVPEQDNIRIDEQPQRVPGDGINSRKCVVEARRTTRAPCHIRKVLHPDASGRLRDTRLLSHEDHLQVVAEKPPAAHRHFLVSTRVSRERLRQRDECQHPQDDPEPTARRAP